MFIEGIVILLFSVSAIIGTLIGFGLAPLYLWIYKKYIGKNHMFAIQDPDTMEHSHGMSKGFFPALMATNFSLILIFDPLIMELPWFQAIYNPADPATIAFPFFLFCSLLVLPSFALFSAAWTIDESGLLSMNRYGSSELQAVGKWFLAFLKGYAGISAVIALYQFTYYLLGFVLAGSHFSIVLFPALLPLLSTVWVIPASILVGVTEGRRNSHILGYAEKIGIRTEFELNIRRIGENPE
jgi:hypothetical protein